MYSKNIHENRINLRQIKQIYIYIYTYIYGACGSIVANELRYYSDCAVIDPRPCHLTFQWHTPFDHTMDLGSTQHLAKMSTRNISWGKGVRCVRLTKLPTNVLSVNLLEPSQSCRAFYGKALPLYIYIHMYIYTRIYHNVTFGLPGNYF